MGDYAHLRTTDATSRADLESDDDSEGFAYLLMKYHVPVLWVALFEEADLRLDEVIDEVRPPERHWILLADKARALQTLSRRTDPLRQMLGARIDPVLAQFTQHLEHARGSRVMLMTDEFSAMLEHAESVWDQELRFCIRTVSGESPAPAAVQVPLAQSEDDIATVGVRTSPHVVGLALAYDRWTDWGKDDPSFVYWMAGGGATEDAPWEE
ncbi:hypothetical protein ACQ86G_08850 [Roseateles chitinivorans]|uniref:hypothetical protein n=1 Tax=Roseateles chitinivorans TaxID=2917965 RepID=UPI003D66E7D4